MVWQPKHFQDRHRKRNELKSTFVVETETIAMWLS